MGSRSRWFVGVLVACACHSSDGAATEGTETGSSGAQADEAPVIYDVGDLASTAYLMLMWTSLNELPLQLVADIELVSDGGGLRSLQPLAVDVGSTSAPRTPVGPPWIPEQSTFMSGGSLDAAFMDVTLPGTANPWNGDPLVADLGFYYTPHGGQRCDCGVGSGNGVVSNLTVGFELQFVVMHIDDADERPSLADVEACMNDASNC
ncbi:MAG TPA: hypothetical protein VG755_21615 [Nannocystaceae bacterium]|nr:hypothetical protein [Nannocystaceae bacterium]